MPQGLDLFQKRLSALCACTLANMKTGNLFCIFKSDIPDFDECITYFNELLCKYGYNIMVLKDCGNRVLIYLYNKNKLNCTLEQAKIQKFLFEYGYVYKTPEEAISILKSRISVKCVPHEIGVFLGYPLQDIKEFINPKKNAVLCGIWKVYGNKKKFEKLFYRYDCCTRTFENKISNGESLLSLVQKLN